MNAVEKYIRFFESVNENTSMQMYSEFFDENSKFKDPFHEVVGLQKIFEIFQKMYHDLDKPTFKVIESVYRERVVYLKWKFNFYFHNNEQQQSFIGVTRVEFNEMDKVIFHEDFWDASENIYEKIPVLKIVLKWVKNKIKS